MRSAEVSEGQGLAHVEALDGASTIQSAEVTSIAETLKDLENDLCRVRSFRTSVIRWSTTVTLAFIRSPGLTVIRIRALGEGTISYHAYETTAPSDLQSVSVPICSTAFEFTRWPPSPTQNAE